MKISVRSALEMLQAMSLLDSYQDGADKPSLYKYSGNTRLRIAIARRKLRAVQEDYNEARNKALLEISDGAGELPSPAGLEGTERKQLLLLHRKFAERERELLAAQVDVAIDPLTAEMLNLDENPIPAAVIDMLGDFIVVT